MRVEEPRHDEWRDALRMHEREMERLRLEIALLERGDARVPRDFTRVQIQFATVQLTRHQINAALLASRLRPRG